MNGSPIGQDLVTSPDNRVLQGLAGLSEFASPLKHWLLQLLGQWPKEGKPRLMVPLGSRGSLPALWAIEAMKKLPQFPDFDLEVHRAAFSIENLSEIVSAPPQNSWVNLV